MKNTYTSISSPIKSWAEDDRPREKLLIKGKQALSDAELIAVLIGSGSRKESAVEVSRKILQKSGFNLNELRKFSVADLMKFKGIGEAKAISIVSALELGRRRQTSEVRARKKIKDSKDVFQLIQPLLSDLPHEEFWILLLNRANKVITYKRISIGGIAGTIADMRVIFKLAFEELASSIILLHNHPSGNANPSQADKVLTEKIYKAGEVLDLPVLDHLIITENGYYSFADEGLI